MKFLVLGCNGMAGHTIALYMREQGHDVTGFDRKKPIVVNGITGDAQNTDLLKKIIQEGCFDSVINCIGILNQHAETNKAAAVFLNSYLPHFLAEVTEKTNTQIIHISTDCVFSGRLGAYTEDDFRDGEAFYDRTKALGEIEDDKNITLRSSIVGPDLNVNGIGLLNWFMKQTKEINGYTMAIWTGQTTLQLAKTMEAAAKEKAHGLYNAVPDNSISKYDLLKLFNHYLKDEALTICPVEGIKADKSLKRTRFDFDYIIPDYEKMICELAGWIRTHRLIYKHYFL